MYPLQSHEIRAIRNAQALREAQLAHMAAAVQVRRRSLPARLAHLTMPGKRAGHSKQSYAATPC